jgi:hypothetical protein
VRICQNLIFSAKPIQQNYCSSQNYSITYLKESEVCFIEIQSNIGSKIELNFTKIITSYISAHIGNVCKSEFIEVIVNNDVYNLCGNWTQSDLLLLPSFSSENSSLIIKIYASNNDLITDKLVEHSLGFCFTYQSLSKSLCQTYKDWFEGPNHCYKVFNERKTWIEAQNTCRANHLNGNLASITSPKIQKILDQFLINQNNK